MSKAKIILVVAFLFASLFTFFFQFSSLKADSVSGQQIAQNSAMLCCFPAPLPQPCKDCGNN